MKVSGSGPTTGPAGPSPKAKAASGFSVGSSAAAPEAQATTRVAGPASVGSLDALIALQGAEDAPSRRRRAVRRAGQLLDLMDEVKVALLEGGSGQAALERLQRTVREAGVEVDDQKLKELLDQIETRAAVELAKREVRSAG